LSGELDMTGTACAAAALKEAGHVVIVDLSALEYIDCYALGALLRARIEELPGTWPGRKNRRRGW
jgi:anti-anti-sigma regulatory factor